MDFSSLPRFKESSFKIIEMIPKWTALYGVDQSTIEKQIHIAHIWCDSNPDRSPRKYPLRFLNSWMARAREFGHFNKIKKGNVTTNALEKQKAYERSFKEDMTLEEMEEIKRANIPQRTIGHLNIQNAITTELANKGE